MLQLLVGNIGRPGGGILALRVSPELAAERGINHGGWVTVVTVRGSVVARALGLEACLHRQLMPGGPERLMV